MSLFDTIKTRAEKFWDEITGEARAELEAALQEAETELIRFGPLLTEFEAAVKQAVADVEPAVKTAVEALVAKLLEDAGALLGTDLAGEPQPPAAA